MLAILERRRLFAVVFTLVLLAGCLLVAQPQIAGAENPSTTGVPAKINIRAALAGAASADIALVDQVTPKPSLQGKSILCVDGDFYAKAGNDVVNDVKEKARGGTPVVFIGGDINGLSLSMGGICEAAANAETEPLVGFAALKLTSGVDGQPVFNNFVAPRGSENVRSTMTGVREWLKKVDEPKTVQANGNWYLRYYSQIYTGDAWYPYGRVLLNRYYYRLNNDFNPNWDFISVESEIEQWSGRAAWDQNWKNDWAYQVCDVRRYQPNNWIIRYSPGSTSGETYATYTLGVDPGYNGGYSALYALSYFQQPYVSCVNSSNTSYGYTEHKWNVVKNSWVSSGVLNEGYSGVTYAHYQYEGPASHYELYRSQFRQYHWYGDNTRDFYLEVQVSNL